MAFSGRIRPASRDNPCFDCADRKAATKDNPRSCHADCVKYAEFSDKLAEIRHQRRTDTEHRVQADLFLFRGKRRERR